MEWGEQSANKEAEWNYRMKKKKQSANKEQGEMMEWRWRNASKKQGYDTLKKKYQQTTELSDGKKTHQSTNKELDEMIKWRKKRANEELGEIDIL